MNAKTYSPKPAELTHDWFVVDAAGLNLGRLSTRIAATIMGKHKVRYSAHLDCGDNVVVVNADKIAVTGNKVEAKQYFHHSGYPGGIKSTTLGELLERHPERVLEHAVAGMIPKNRLHDDRLRRLKIYAGPTHPHNPQNPKPLEGTN
jgi:large subunit ribosomal protein L13